MVGKCANNSCSASFRYLHEGKLFRVDIDVANTAGERKRKTEYLWLCSQCALRMNPKIEVEGQVVKVRLALNAQAVAEIRNSPPSKVN